MASNIDKRGDAFGQNGAYVLDKGGGGTFGRNGGNG